MGVSFGSPSKGRFLGKDLGTTGRMTRETAELDFLAGHTC